MAQAGLSRVGEIVRRHDPDRFFTALFAPADRRDALFTLYAFNHELARASEVTREPFAALIRLQWWREVVEGARRRHEVAGPLGDALDSGLLLPADLAAMVDAREAEVEPIPDLPAFEHYVKGTAGRIMVAAARLLGMDRPERLQAPGAAYGIAGILRHAAALERSGRRLLPADGTDAATLTVLGRTWLATRPPVPRQARAAALPLVLAARHLWGRTTQADRLAVTWAALTGHLP